MARLRTRAHRSLLLVIALAILALLLEMNRFLPGTWSGGDGGGVRQASHSGPRLAADVPERETPDKPEDPASVTPPETAPPDWPPREGMRVELRAATGRLETDWHFGVGDGGTESDRPDDDGVLRSRDRRVHRQGFRIRSEGGLIRHSHGIDDPAARWVVGLPRAALPRQRAQAPIALTVVDRMTGKPVSGAQVERSDRQEAGGARTGADGRLMIRGRGRENLIPLEVSAPSYAPRTVVLSTRDPVPPAVALERWVDVQLVIAANHAGPPIVSKGYVRHRDGRVLAQFKGTAPSLRLRESDVAEAWVEVHVLLDPERGIVFPFQVPLPGDSTAVAVPENSILEVNVRNPEGLPIRGARVRSRFTQASSSEQGLDLGEDRLAQVGGAETDEAGRAYLAVPVSSPFAVLVQAPLAAPFVRRFQAGDGNAPLEVITERGLLVPVRVRGPEGRALAGAQVIARASVGGLRIAPHATTDAHGRAELGPLGAGPVEIFAWTPGHGWAAVVETAAGAMGTVELRLPRAEHISLVVEDPFGVALEGVRAEVTPADGGRPLVSPPLPVSWRSSRNGRLDIPDLPDRLYEVTLTLPGYTLEKLENLRPGNTKYFATLVPKN